MRERRWYPGVAGALLVVLTGCSGGNSHPSAAGSTPTAAASRGPVLTYVALGDSWPEGAHCTCTTFAQRYAHALEKLAGRPVAFKDFTGSSQPFFQTDGGGSASLLKALRAGGDIADAVASADVVLIATGPNEMGRAYTPYQKGKCGGADGEACIRNLERFWQRNFNAILSFIERVRAGRPTAVRLLDANNAFLGNPDMTRGMPSDFATHAGADIFAALTTAICRSAKAHHDKCVPLGHILNGPHGSRPADENSDATQAKITRALAATGLPELRL